MKKCLFIVAVLFLSACSRRKDAVSYDFTVSRDIIIDTDTGNSLDDLLAMDILFHEQKAGRFSLLGVMVNHDVPLAAQTVDIMNTWYGCPQTPVGIVHDGVKDSQIWEDYCPLLCSRSFFGDGEASADRPYRRSIADCSVLPDAVSLYRKILSGRPDSSVTILSIGFLTNLAALLASVPDEYSELPGSELVRRKVRGIVAMCGSADEPEYNIKYDIASASAVFAGLPVGMNIIPGEVHLEISTEDINAAAAWAEHHPLALAYTTHNPDDVNWCWDASAALALVGNMAGVTLSEPCDISIAEDGRMIVSNSPDGRFRMVSLTAGQQEALERSVLGNVATEF